MKLLQLEAPEQGFFSVEDRLYEVTSVPVEEAGTQVATLTVGGRFDITRFGVPAVLLHKGASNRGGICATWAPARVEKALAAL